MTASKRFGALSGTAFDANPLFRKGIYYGY